MKGVVFKELHLVNVGCFADKTVEFGEHTTSISGANGCGKTTIADALCWMFTDKLMNGNAADLRPHDAEGNTLNGNDVLASLYLTVDGAEYVIDKSVSRCAKGNEVIYAVNGVQKRPQAYKEFVEDTFGVTVEQFGYCLSAQHFLKSDTSVRKSVLFDLVNVDGDSKLAADDERFIELVPRLDVATIEECLAECRRALRGYGKQKGLNTQLDYLYERFDELSRVAAAVAVEQPHEYFKKRLTELAEQTKATQSQIVQTERTQDLLRQFAKYKTETLQKRVNALFEVAEFTFSEPTLTGDPRDICDLRYKGERYGKRLNTGARIYMEHDIVRGFQKAYGLSLPYIIDNAESVSAATQRNIGERNHQLIFTAVSNVDKLLIERS